MCLTLCHGQLVAAFVLRVACVALDPDIGDLVAGLLLQRLFPQVRVQGVGAYNGDIGIVESINTRERSMVVRMDDRRLVYPAENLNELEIAYAITVHKSQGSEFPAVILPVAQVPPRLCYRNLFYTGVTRARKLCIVAGRRDVANRMMSNVRQNLRYSGLCALLQAELPPEQVRVEESRLQNLYTFCRNYVILNSDLIFARPAGFLR